MATQSVVDSLPTFIYDIYRAKGTGTSKPAQDSTRLQDAHELAERFARKCDEQVARTSVADPSSFEYKRELTSFILEHKSISRLFDGMHDDDWIGTVAAAFYCGVGKKTMLAAVEKKYGQGWKALLVGDGVARRGANRPGGDE